MNQLMSEQEAQPMEFGGATAAIRSGTRRPFKPPSSKRQQITAAEAIEIYKLRPVPGEGEGDGREPIAYARVDRRDRRACGLRESAAGVCSVLPPAPECREVDGKDGAPGAGGDCESGVCVC